MKPNIGRRLDKALTLILGGFGVMVLLLVGLYSIPVNVVDIDKLQTDKLSYTKGDVILVSSEGQTFETATSTYDRRFVCRNGVEQREQIDSIILNTTPRPLAKVTTEFKAPLRITGHSCIIQITAKGEVQIAPYLTKTVVEIFETNAFEVIE